jgi:hypothetical protein
MSQALADLRAAALVHTSQLSTLLHRMAGIAFEQADAEAISDAIEELAHLERCIQDIGPADVFGERGEA